jgi:hypothetical protein
MAYLPMNFGATVINEESKQVPQPDRIKTELKPHQLAMIHQMKRLENPTTKSLKVEGDGEVEADYTFQTNFGCICDKVGSGKSLTVLGLIANNPILTPSNRCYTSYSGVVSIFNKRKSLIPINLLVVPHGIMNQWAKYIDNDTDLDFKTIKNKKTLEASLIDINAYIENPLENLHLIQTDLYLVSSSMYNKFVGVFNNHLISRIIVDEVETIKVAGANYVAAEFTWFISSSKLILKNPMGQSSYEPYSYSGWNGNVYHVQRRVVVDKMAHTGFFRDILAGLSRSRITDTLYLSSDEEFIKKSFELPEFVTNVIKCKNTNHHNILNGIVDNETMNMINAGDISGAMEHIGCEKHSEESLVSLVTKKLNVELDNKRKELEYKLAITYTTALAKQQAVDKLQKEINEIEKKIECVKLRVVENTTCPVCCDEISNKVIVTCCNNPFCFECISMSISHKPQCPVCRASIGISDILAVGEEEEECGCKEEEKEETDEDREKFDNFKIYFEKVMEKGNSKVLVFSEYEASFNKVKEYLSQNSQKFSELKGATTRIDNIVSKFKSESDERFDVLLLNAKYFGSGLNLQNTTDIFLYHKMGESMTKQVIGRAQRPGRTNTLNVWKLCYENEI